MNRILPEITAVDQKRAAFHVRKEKARAWRARSFRQSNDAATL